LRRKQREEEEELRRKQRQEEESRRKREEEELKRQHDELRKTTTETVAIPRTILENVNQVAFQIDTGVNRSGWRKVFVTIFRGQNLVACNIANGQSDPFVVGKQYSADGKIKAKMKTKIIQANRIDPFWDETMEFRDFDEHDYISLTVWDDGKTGFDFMGEIRLKRKEIIHAHRGWHALKDLPKKEKPFHPGHESKKIDKETRKEKKEKTKDKHKDEEKDEEKKKGNLLSNLTTGVKEKATKAKDTFVKKEGLAADTILDSVSKSRNVIKSKLRGKKNITGDIELSFETIF